MAAVPTLFDWAGGSAALDRLTEVFYRRVHADPLPAPVFVHVGDDHAHHVAVWQRHLMDSCWPWGREPSRH